MNDPGPWQWMAGEERGEASPGEPLRARAPFQPFAPRLRDLLAILMQPSEVPRDAVVGIVTDELGRQPGELIEDRPMPIGSAPVLDRGQRAGKAGLRRRLPHHVLALARLHPRVSEAEEVTRMGSLKVSRA